MKLLEKVKDLYLQATTDHTHYYTASVLEEVIEFLESSKNPQAHCFSCYEKNRKVIEAIAILEKV